MPMQEIDVYTDLAQLQATEDEKRMVSARQGIMCVCVCVCVREREREGEKEQTCCYIRKNVKYICVELIPSTYSSMDFWGLCHLPKTRCVGHMPVHRYCRILRF